MALLVIGCGGGGGPLSAEGLALRILWASLGLGDIEQAQSVVIIGTPGTRQAESGTVVADRLSADSHELTVDLGEVQGDLLRLVFYSEPGGEGSVVAEAWVTVPEEGELPPVSFVEPPTGIELLPIGPVEPGDVIVLPYEVLGESGAIVPVNPADVDFGLLEPGVATIENGVLTVIGEGEVILTPELAGLPISGAPAEIPILAPEPRP